MGLRGRMAVSYVLVTLGAVLLVEAVLLALSARTISDQVNAQDLLGGVRTQAYGMALKLSSQASATRGAGFAPAATSSPAASGGPVASGGPAASGAGPAPSPTDAVKPVPAGRGDCVAAQKSGFTLVVSPDRTVLSSTYPGCWPLGSRAPALPAGVQAGVQAGGQGTGVGDGLLGDRAAWARAPVVEVRSDQFTAADPTTPADLLGLPGARQIATLYAERPTTPPAGTFALSNARPLVIPGLVVLGAAVPVGLLFGYTSMRSPIRRLRRLAVAARALADGDLDRRVPVTGRDELSGLEADINRMAVRLSAAMATEAELAATRATAAERSRIARELHDSLSQELFSLRLLAAGVARALPAGSPVAERARDLERSAATANREMQALVLELRPAALAEGGLAGALATLAGMYRHRLGLTVHTSLPQVAFGPQREHALLRIAQEAVANAVRHGQATEVTLALDAGGLRVRDDGRGFDPDAPAKGMGLALMRERAAEITAQLTVTSQPGGGTTIEVHLACSGC